MTKLTCDPQEIQCALSLLFSPGDVVELRVLDAQTASYRSPRVESGYFDDWSKLVNAAATIDKGKGWYVTLNPVNPALLARAANRIRPAGKEPLTSDTNIVRRRWLPIDLDAVRPAGISSTNEEHQAALDFASTIRDHLAAIGWPEPILADSGNGAHLLYRIDLPAEDGALVERCLKALAARFGAMSDRVDIDTAVHNPARIWKLYGTPACKGDSTADRPHRMARLLAVPSTIEAVPVQLLEALAGPVAAEATATRQQSTGRFDLDQWIAERGLGVRGPEPWQGGRRWVFDVCPWNPQHTNGSAFIIQQSSGAIGAGCHHNDCSGRGWHELRDVIEPGWRARRAEKPTGTGKHAAKQEAPVLSPVPAFAADLLPDAMRPWVEDIAERMQCPLDFPAVGAMIALAGAVGRRVGIRPKLRDSWMVVPNLWGLLIGRPGIMKSPPLKEVLKPVHRLEIRAAEEYAKEMLAYKARAMVVAARKKVGAVAIEKAVKKGGDDPDRIAAALLEEEEQPPTLRRYIVNDSTVEKMGMILGENPNGLLVFRDEIQGLLRGLDKPGREDYRAFYLECWAGDGPFACDRVGRGTLKIEACCLSLLGTIQPGPLTSYLFSAAVGGQGDDGLLQRFQLAAWPDVSGDWVNIDEWPNKEARDRAYAVVERLADLDPKAVDAQCDDHDGVPFLRFDHNAQPAFDEWRGDLERTLRAGTMPLALESVLAKHRSLIPSIALLIHLADGGRGAVPRAALDKAVGWGRYLFGHAQRIYATAEGGNDGNREEALLAAVRRLGGRITPHDLRHHGFGGDADAAETAIERLVKGKHGVWEVIPPGPRGGRPTRVFVLTTTKTETETETPSKPEKNVGFGFGVGLVPDVNTLFQEAALADAEVTEWTA